MKDPDSSFEYKTGHTGIDKNRPTLILVHGSGGSAGTWAAQVNPLDRHLNTIALSLPGHGMTPGPLLTSTLEYGVWLEKAIEGFGLTDRPFLVGASLGGAVVLETVRLKPDRYAGLVLIATGADLGSSVEIIGKLGQNWPETARRFIRLIFADHVDSRTRERSYEALLAAGPEVLAADLSVSRNVDNRKGLKDIPVPCLVIGGDQDRVSPPDKQVFLVENLPHARLILLENAGHMVIIERYRAVNEALLTFVEDILSENDTGRTTVTSDG